jgi:adenylate kinase family enzyme
MNLKAIVLIGHSSSGKTPLGAQFEGASDSGARRYCHFDFGEHLRAIAAGRISAALTATDIRFVQSILGGALLDDEHFYIASRILDWFLSKRRFDPSRDILVLNGLPRHVGQARDLARYGVVFTLAVHCDCTPEIALVRKNASERGEGHESRAGRSDSASEIFRQRVATFNAKTLPLLDYFRESGITVVRVPIEPATAPSQVFARIKPHIQI